VGSGSQLHQSQDQPWMHVEFQLCWQAMGLLGLCENAGMPNQPKTPITGVRIPLDLKAAAQAKAAERGESLSDVVRRGLVEYVAEP
jgi:predicted HicB family RNase H-like nuclease